MKVSPIWSNLNLVLCCLVMITATATANFCRIRRCRFCQSRFLSWLNTLSPWQYKTRFTVDSDSGVPEVFISWQTWAVVVPGLFLNNLTNAFSSEGDILGLLSDLSKVVRHPNNCLNSWTDDLEISTCLVKGPRDLPNMYNSTIFLLRSSPRTLVFPIVLSIGQSNQYSQTNDYLLPIVVSNHH